MGNTLEEEQEEKKGMIVCSDCLLVLNMYYILSLGGVHVCYE